VAALSLSLGCSFAMVKPVRPKPEHPGELGCTTDAGPPVVDLLLTGLGGVFALNAAGSQGGETTFILSGGLAAVALFSSVYGFSSVHRCQALTASARGAGPTPTPSPALPSTPDGAD
jgi:hypothetical protein